MKSFRKNIVFGFIFTFVFAMIFISTTDAQDMKFRQQAWRYGLNLGYQFNSAGLGWQYLHGLDPNFQSPEDDITYVDGTGNGIYLGLFGEYLSESWWGFQFRVSYDVRDALIMDDTRTPIPSFDTKMSYLTFEPLFRVDQNLIPNLNFFVGPFLAYNLSSTYIFRYDKDVAAEEAEREVPDVVKLTWGLQGGLAYDIRISDLDQNSSLYLSPFFTTSWIANQRESIDEPDQNSIGDVWSTVAYRIGVRFSIEHRDPVEGMPRVSKSPIPPSTNIVAIAMPTDNTIVTKNVKGYFPIHPYVFFDKESLDFPRRYKTLTYSEAQNFNESDLSNFDKGDLTVKETNVDQLMVAYYNVMNVYGDRMRKNPSVQLTLRGSDPEEKEAEVHANKVKNYLVTNFGINPDRIAVITDPPYAPSGSDETEVKSAELIKDENRRVKFVFSNSDMYKPLVYTIRDETSIDNDMLFSIDNSVPFRSWDITITGEGRTMYFGPYSYSSARINPAELMRFLENGQYNAKVSITDRTGKITTENVSFRLTKDTELKNASRYLMIFDYNQSDAVRTYETTIRNDIVKGIGNNDRVIVHGHTDIIGTPEGNMKLSKERAEETKSIIDDQLRKDNKTTINVTSMGMGERKTQYTFDNKYPEGRMYNRNVFVEIVEGR
jgi:outer membrane protein OmpA-like peptidoglycan-associated protein